MARKPKIFTVISAAFSAATRAELIRNFEAETKAGWDALWDKQREERAAFEARLGAEATAYALEREEASTALVSGYDVQRIADVAASVSSHIAAEVRVPSELLAELSASQHPSAIPAQVPHPGGKAKLARAFAAEPAPIPPVPPGYPGSY